MKNLTEMMKQVQSMQSRMGDVQEKLGAETVYGQSGGGKVKVTMTGKLAVIDLAIDPSLMIAEDKQILEDLIITALADAKTKAENLMAEEMKAVTGGISLPPGFKLPF